MKSDTSTNCGSFDRLRILSIGQASRKNPEIQSGLRKIPRPIFHTKSIFCALLSNKSHANTLLSKDEKKLVKVFEGQLLTRRSDLFDAE